MIKGFVKYYLFVILAVLVFFIYSETLNAPFLFDDSYFVVNNYSIRDITNLEAIRNGIVQPSRFIGLFSFALNYHFSQLDSFSFHLTNTLIHLITSVFVWWFCFLLLSWSRQEFSSKTNKYLISFTAALIFASHPCQTQAVSYISQRLASLATMFYIGSLCFYFKGRQGKSIFFLGALGSAFLAMQTKEIAITLPLAILLIEYIILKIYNKNSTEAKSFPKFTILILFLFTLIIPAMFSFNVFSIFFTPRMSASHDGDVLTFSSYMLTQIRVFGTFFRLLVVPLGQNLDYDFPMTESFFDPKSIINFMYLGCVFYAGIFLRKKKPLISFGIFWMFLTLLPNLVPRYNVIFEHKLYLVSVGFCIALSILIFEVVKDRKKFIGISVAIVLLLSFLSFQRNKVWTSDLILWEDVVKKSPLKERPYINLGKAYIDAKKVDDAIRVLGIAIELNPLSYKAFNNRGIAYRINKQYDLSLADLNKSLKINPKFFKAYGNRGKVYEDIGKHDLAMEDFEESLRIEIENPEVFNNLGMSSAKLKDFDTALVNYNKALYLNPIFVEAYNNRGILRRLKGAYIDALNDYNKALSLNPNLTEGYNGRGAVYYHLGEFESSINDYVKALDLDPEYIRALNNRGIVYKVMKDYENAFKDFNAAIAIDPEYLSAYFNRADIHINQGNLDLALDDYNKTLELDPDNIDVVYNRAVVYRAKKELDAALIDLNRVIEERPEFKLAYFMRSLVNKEKNMTDAALEDAKKAKEFGLNVDKKYIDLLEISLEADKLNAEFQEEDIIDIEESIIKAPDIDGGYTQNFSW